MLGGKHKQPLGYTIIEVMIVLAVSGLMFIISTLFINGKQAQTSFTQGVNGMASNIQSIIEQVTDGQYSDIPLKCLYYPIPKITNPNIGTSPGSSQGTNSTCVFLGKIMHFKGSSNYELVSLAGGRVDNSDNLLTSLSQADPKVINSLTINQTVPQSLSISRITVFRLSGLGQQSSQSYAIGFLQSQGALNNGGFESGAQTTQIYYDNANTPIGTPFNPGNLRLAYNVDICLTDETRYAEITFGVDRSGTNSNPLSVAVKMDGTTKPVSLCG